MITKICPHCNSSLPLSAFYRKGSGHQVYCKQCRKGIDHAAYIKNAEKIKLGKKKWRTAFNAWYDSLKSGRPCVDCGGVFHIEAMEWDHLPQFEKVASLSQLRKDKRKSEILGEIAKCELVCANCHAVRTFNRRCKKI